MDVDLNRLFPMHVIKCILVFCSYVMKYDACRRASRMSSYATMAGTDSRPVYDTEISIGSLLNLAKRLKDFMCYFWLTIPKNVLVRSFNYLTGVTSSK